jgi:hypothetical protein
MPKIEIDNLNDLINQKYPVEYIKKIIDEILNISILVKTDYPDYKDWFLNKQIPGVYDGSRNIIVAHIKGHILGFVSLKKDITEKKICTFYVAKTFRRNKVGSTLTKESIEWLECDKPLITIPNDKLFDFIGIARKYDWEVTDIKNGLYRVNNPEIILNGAISNPEIETIEPKPKTKSLTHIWFFYQLNKVKSNFLLLKSILSRI